METLARILDASIPEPNSGCWLWLGSVQGSGHGRLKWHGRTTPAHRLAWMLFNGPIPDGMLVCHKCDVPCCVNPDHLFLGTHADNHADRNRKGRQAKGENSGRAKLRANDVLAIASDPRPIRKIAASYGMGYSQVSRIKRGMAWKHLAFALALALCLAGCGRYVPPPPPAAPQVEKTEAVPTPTAKPKAVERNTKRKHR